MRWWRIADPAYALDRSGQGMAQFGGRWNPRGVPAIYAAESIALASLEKWVHLSGVMPSRPYALVSIDVPEKAAGLIAVDQQDLPVDWHAMPSSRAAERLGANLLRPDDKGHHLTLGFTIPSVIVQESRNLVLNPLHPGMAAIEMRIEREFVFDGRMIKGR